MSVKSFVTAGALALLGVLGPLHAVDGFTHSTIRLGQAAGLTGTVAAPVKEMNEGALAYFSIINKRGGVHGRKIELVTLDDKFDPVISKTNAEILIKKSVCLR